MRLQQAVRGRQAVMAAAGDEHPVEKPAAAATAGRRGMEDGRLI
jgi:hypothetical protein